MDQFYYITNAETTIINFDRPRYRSIGSNFTLTLLNLRIIYRIPNDPRSLVKDFALVLFGLPLSENLENKLVEILMDGAAEYDWDINASGANYRLKELVKYMLRLPEAQLA